MNEFLYGFLTWFKAFLGNMLDGVVMVFKGIFFGIAKIFNIPYYFKLWADEKVNFGAMDWILSILAFILAFAIWAGLIFLLVLALAAFAAVWYYTGGDLTALPQRLQSLGADSLPHAGAKLI